MKKIYDCFLFWKEFTALEIRLNELYEVVDKFIIVEFSQGHSGLEKPFYLKDKMADYVKFADKIELFSLDVKIKNRGPLHIGHGQRKILDKIIFDLKPESNDLILTSDSDEIVRADLLRGFKLADDVDCNVVFELNLYHNKLNNYFGNWIRPRLISYRKFKGFSHSYRDVFVLLNSKFRRFKWIPLMRVNPFFSATKFDVWLGTWIGFNRKKLAVVKNAGWHFTKIYSLEDNVEHARNTPHLEAVQNGINKEEISARIESKLTSYGKVAKGRTVEIDNSFPSYVLQNKAKFSEYIELRG
jgi:beta-1,4-mannosyl-glycoprotein beta-1,4-N-acetylglucosaminyltransferase